MNPLSDPFGRRIEYLRLSVTDRCDLRCVYCMPQGFTDFKTPEQWLTFNEIETVLAAFANLGLRRVRITGGEPLVRKGLPELLQRIGALPGIEDLSLSTNGVQLTRHAKALRRAGVSRLNVSLDTLDSSCFRAITGGRLEKVLAGLDAAREAGFDPIKINTVLMRGINDDVGDIVRMVNYCAEHGFTLRFIETMPVGHTGRESSARYVHLEEVRRHLEQRFELVPAIVPGGGPARYVEVAGTNLKIGFITPLSQHFCDTCNRVRLSVDGTLYLCLGRDHSYPLREVLRNGASGEELEQHILVAIARKPQGHEFHDSQSAVVGRFMSITGG